MTSTERVDAVLAGRKPDRIPFTFYHHFHLESFGGERHAQATFEFHNSYKTDLVKVMSDFPFPKPESGPWYRMPVVDNPYPQQLRALESIRTGLGGTAYFIETVFNPFKVAENLSSPAAVQKLIDTKPDVLQEALHTIAQSQANHAKRAAAAGAKGIFLAIANADESVLTREEYEQYSRPFDRMVLDAVADLPLNTLHIHGTKVFLEEFYQGWPAAVLQYSSAGTGVPLEKVRTKYAGVLLGGIDEIHYRQLGEPQLRQQMLAAMTAAGTKLILAPGCSVPDDCTEAELLKLPNIVGA